MIDTAHLSDTQVLACTLYGEARSESPEGILLVANVIRNRVVDKRWPDDYRGVCLQPWQFSCWRKDGGEGNYNKLATLVAALKQGVADPRYLECAWIATGVVNGWVRDTAFGADHYHTVKMNPKPKWAQGFVPLNNIHPFPKSSHLFYKLAPIAKTA